MDPIQCSNLEPGDILLKHAKGKEGLGIATVQLLTGHGGIKNFYLQHAAIVTDPPWVVEARNAGLCLKHLWMEHADNTYIVFRTKVDGLAAGAAAAAEMLHGIHAAQGTMPYARKRDLRNSLFGTESPRSDAEVHRVFDDVLKGCSHTFFCSQIIVFSYHFAAEQKGLIADQIFRLSDEKATPGRLAVMLKQNTANFSLVGKLRPRPC